MKLSGPEFLALWGALSLVVFILLVAFIKFIDAIRGK